MAEGRAQRRLAAILAADVVGYSRLMEQDEAGTLAALADRRKAILEPLLAKYRGRVVRLMGDGTLAEFASAVDAVQCAVDIQKAMREANSKLPDDRAIVLRVGLNLGDVVVEDRDIYGDGVNVAARLEAMAEPGGICLSAAIHQQVERLLPFAFRDLGDQALKNIARPVRVYCIADDDGAGGSAPRPTTPTGHSFSVQSKPSVAVLPFVNMSGDQEQEYFSDGITEDIITELSRFRSLFVIARNSSFQYRDKAADVRRVARELGAQYVVEGSIRKAGNRVRVTAQLIDAATGKHVWAERFDRSDQDIFAVQDEVVSTIAGTLVGRLHAAGTEHARRKPPASLAAYECVLRGNALPHGDREADAEARQLFERAIALDPDYGRAHALLAMAEYYVWSSDPGSSDGAVERAVAAAKKAAALDENDSICQSVLGWFHLLLRAFDLAEQQYRKARDLNPNSPTDVACMGTLYNYLGRPDEAMAYLEEAKRLDRFFDPAWYWHRRGTVHFVARRYDDAIVDLAHGPIVPLSARAYVAACYAHTGRIDRAREVAAEILLANPGFSIAQHLKIEPYKRQEDIDHLATGLRKAGLPE
jgi:TolB-like protein/tetratricopeptide (TPR) repeat protein